MRSGIKSPLDGKGGRVGVICMEQLVCPTTSSASTTPSRLPAMALPRQLQPSLTPDELAFLAEEDVVDIVPLFSMTKVRLLSVSRDRSGAERGDEQRSEAGRGDEQQTRENRSEGEGREVGRSEGERRRAVSSKEERRGQLRVKGSEEQRRGAKRSQGGYRGGERYPPLDYVLSLAARCHPRQSLHSRCSWLALHLINPASFSAARTSLLLNPPR
jgi:hypothetical protein